MRGEYIGLLGTQITSKQKRGAVVCKVNIQDSGLRRHVLKYQLLTDNIFLVLLKFKVNKAITVSESAG